MINNIKNNTKISDCESIKTGIKIYRGFKIFISISQQKYIKKGKKNKIGNKYNIFMKNIFFLNAKKNIKKIMKFIKSVFIIGISGNSNNKGKGSKIKKEKIIEHILNPQLTLLFSIK